MAGFSSDWARSSVSFSSCFFLLYKVPLVGFLFPPGAEAGSLSGNRGADTPSDVREMGGVAMVVVVFVLSE